MHLKYFNSGFIFAMAISCTGCRTREVESSDTKHIAGQLSRAPKMELRPDLCPQESYLTGRADVRAYLRKIFKTITDANPEIFQGTYAPEKFCIANDKSPVFNAHASREGIILFFDKIVLAAPNDAAVAGIMAHESAHIIMQHHALIDQYKQQKYVDHPALDANAEWQRYLQSRLTEHADLERKLADAKAQLEESERKRDVFVGPMRNLLSEPLRELEKSAQNGLDSVKERIQSATELS
jgi:hypothetical protein